MNPWHKNCRRFQFRCDEIRPGDVCRDSSKSLLANRTRWEVMIYPLVMARELAESLNEFSPQSSFALVEVSLRRRAAADCDLDCRQPLRASSPPASARTSRGKIGTQSGARRVTESPVRAQDASAMSPRRRGCHLSSSEHEAAVLAFAARGTHRFATDQTPQHPLRA